MAWPAFKNSTNKMIREKSEIKQQYQSRITPPVVDWLMPDEIFVFGSNEAGIHGAGAARTALELFGAKHGEGIGFTGQCYAIPTKDRQIETLSLDIIEKYIDLFLHYVPHYPTKTFLVTQIGCGLAGYTPEQIAPLFAKAVDLDNVHLPAEFWEVLNRN